MNLEINNYNCYHGKVRDCYEFGQNMLIIVASDRISAFDYILPETNIPDKGKILTQLSLYWAETLDIPYHLVSSDINQMPEEFRKPEFDGRTMLVEKANVIPYECIVRGYLTGSGWAEYKKNGEICGIRLPAGLHENQQFPKPIFTPTTKAKTGHDENVTFETVAKEIGLELASQIEQLSIELYMEAAQLAWMKGIIIADTKFEWGILPHLQNSLVLVDEILTPDSSRFWPLEDYKLDTTMPSFDKQFVRNWLNVNWDKKNSPPPLPEDVIAKTKDKYIEAYKKLTGSNYV